MSAYAEFKRDFDARDLKSLETFLQCDVSYMGDVTLQTRPLIDWAVCSGLHGWKSLTALWLRSETSQEYVEEGSLDEQTLNGWASQLKLKSSVIKGPAGLFGDFVRGMASKPVVDFEFPPAGQEGPEEKKVKASSLAVFLIRHYAKGSDSGNLEKFYVAWLHSGAPKFTTSAVETVAKKALLKRLKGNKLPPVAGEYPAEYVDRMIDFGNRKVEGNFDSKADTVRGFLETCCKRKNAIALLQTLFARGLARENHATSPFNMEAEKTVRLNDLRELAIDAELYRGE